LPWEPNFFVPQRADLEALEALLINRFSLVYSGHFSWGDLDEMEFAEYEFCVEQFNKVKEKEKKEIEKINNRNKGKKRR